MLIEFLFELRRRKIPVSTHEWMALMEALALGLHESSLDGFYHLCRTLCVKDIAYYDAYDEAFLAFFKDVHKDALEVFFGLRATPRLRKKPSTSELIDWICALKKAGVDLARVSGGIPFLGTLLKTEQDVELVGKRAKA